MIPTSYRRHALELLAASAEGCTEALLLAHGFRPALIAELTETGLARARTERLLVGERHVQVTRVRITEIGQAVLERRGV